MEEIKRLVDTIVKGIQEKKGLDIVIVDIRKIEGAICQYFVICTGQSPTQVQAITDSIAETTRKEIGEKPVKTVGEDNCVWVAMDYTDVMVHVFVPDTREYYDLDHLYEDARKTKIMNEE
ncbi:MAG: ribosome silencing factor [Prevotella sp.]|nr:ribosome silencing factor [Prevotella sp.]